jgi:hypothetical protein
LSVDVWEYEWVLALQRAQLLFSSAELGESRFALDWFSVFRLRSSVFRG